MQEWFRCVRARYPTPPPHTLHPHAPHLHRGGSRCVVRAALKSRGKTARNSSEMLIL
ncbi:hypothetical protein E2C01_096109 [Portunus trituberculatus]|uniref:Uncharacterized protein n=1 Tax=Portunus trituberculatus TaxID=210409 RepID=A0A5B7K1Y2_PORTR|nr:hypothetical protein [Portunus trituberculatus]